MRVAAEDDCVGDDLAFQEGDEQRLPEEALAAAVVGQEVVVKIE
jgi:hypothetical protein